MSAQSQPGTVAGAAFFELECEVARCYHIGSLKSDTRAELEQYNSPYHSKRQQFVDLLPSCRCTGTAIRALELYMISFDTSSSLVEKYAVDAITRT